MDFTTIPSDFPFKTFGTFVPGKGGFAFIDEAAGLLNIYEFAPAARNPVTRYKAKSRLSFLGRAREGMRSCLAEQLAQIAKRSEERAALARQKAEFDARTVYTVGAIVVHTWGWEQTNKCFYEVTAVSQKSVTLRKLKSETLSYNSLNYAGTCAPLLGQYDDRNGENGRHSAGPSGIRMENGIGQCRSGLANLWDGKPCRFTDGA